MQILPFCLGLLSSSIGLISATALPELEARAPSPCVNNQRTLRFGFDAQPTGQPPPNGLGQLHWNNWVVQNRDSACSGVSNTCIPPKPQAGNSCKSLLFTHTAVGTSNEKAATSSKVSPAHAVADAKAVIVSNDANAVSIANANNQGFGFFNLNSFYFGCAQFGSFGLITSGCTLQVVSKVFSATDQIRVNTYTYNGTYQNPAMTKVNYNNGGDHVYFSVVQGSGIAVLYLDSFEVVQPCNS